MAHLRLKTILLDVCLEFSSSLTIDEFFAILICCFYLVSSVLFSSEGNLERLHDGNGAKRQAERHSLRFVLLLLGFISDLGRSNAVSYL